MLKYFPLIILLLIQTVTAQVTVRGKVLSEATEQPLAGASVYFNNTSIGTLTNDKGEFVLPDVASFNTELVISSVGYELIVFKTDASQVVNKNLVFKLPVKEESLKDVLIVSDALRQRWLKIFRENFLGITEEAERSLIQNMKDIYFTSGSSKSSFHAYADAPLVIVNEMLGYKLSFQLIDFSFDGETGITYFYGYTRYENMGDKKRWIKNRLRAYYGSTVHFFRSLIRDNLKQEGYRIYVLKTLSSAEKDSNTIVLKSRKDKSGEVQVAASVTAAQIIKQDTVNADKFLLKTDGTLMVQYDKNPASKSYLSRKTMIQGSMPNGFRSYVKLAEEFLMVDRNGIIDNPVSVQYSGYWMYEKAANLLPFNYEPGD